MLSSPRARANWVMPSPALGCLAWLAASLRDERRRASGLVGPVQPLDLPYAQSQTLSHMRLRRAPLSDALHPLDSIQLSSAHRQQPQRHGGTGTRNPTSLSGTNPTLSLGAYKRKADFERYVNSRRTLGAP